MARPRHRLLRWVGAAVLAIAVVLGAAAYIWRDDILRTALDPKLPYQTYRPPPAPDYASAIAWALIPPDPAHPHPSDLPVDIVFLSPTVYDGGRDYNAPLDDAPSQRRLVRVMLPNYAGPFQRVGRVFAPQYRQASLFAYDLSQRDDSRQARELAYADVRRAFQTYLELYNQGRPFILAGVEQGGNLADRLLQQVIGPDPALRGRLVAAYLMETIAPASAYSPASPIPACQQPRQPGCVLAWQTVDAGDDAAAGRILKRALVWAPSGLLENLRGPALCVNPMTGAEGRPYAPAKLDLGSTNASGLEWGLRPAFLPRQVSAECRGGLLWVSRPESPSLRRPGSWIGRHRAPPYDLFYENIEADAMARAEARLGRSAYGAPAPPITTSIPVPPSPIHRIP